LELILGFGFGAALFVVLDPTAGELLALTLLLLVPTTVVVPVLEVGPMTHDSVKTLRR
jgi:hypothetical protein